MVGAPQALRKHKLLFITSQVSPRPGDMGMNQRSPAYWELCALVKRRRQTILWKGGRALGSLRNSQADSIGAGVVQEDTPPDMGDLKDKVEVSGRRKDGQVKGPA